MGLFINVINLVVLFESRIVGEKMVVHQRSVLLTLRKTEEVKVNFSFATI